MLPDTAHASVLSDYLTKNQLAEQLGRSIRTIDRMALSGDGPPRTRIGRTTLYRREAVLEWLRSRELPADGHSSRRRGVGR
jgi:predicted DNA-binding transcriptional regulator AlpA